MEEGLGRSLISTDICYLMGVHKGNGMGECDLFSPRGRVLCHHRERASLQSISSLTPYLSALPSYVVPLKIQRVDKKRHAVCISLYVSIYIFLYIITIVNINIKVKGKNKKYH